MIWIILELAKFYLKLVNSRFQCHWQTAYKNEKIPWNPWSTTLWKLLKQFSLSVAIMKARRAAKGVQYRPRIFSFHVITRVGLRCALTSFRIPALRKHCGPCEAHYVPEGSAVFRHTHLLSILRLTLHWWSAALRSSIVLTKWWWHLTTQRIHDSQVIQVYVVAKYCKEISCNPQLSIYLRPHQKLQPPHGSQTHLGLQAQWCQRDVNHLNTLFSKAFGSQCPRLTLSPFV